MQNAAMILIRVEGELSNGFNWELTKISKLFYIKQFFYLRSRRKANMTTLEKSSKR